jgi:2-polyprenyl-6-methoxyphenol hydroxylase-like FAD-dependent oxidoreductase
VCLNIIIVGAGLSGLATAISSALSGHDVTIFESANALQEVCALAWDYSGQAGIESITISPNIKVDTL